VFFGDARAAYLEATIGLISTLREKDWATQLVKPR
jgi:hypothetical protein